MTKPAYTVQVAFGVNPLTDPTSGQWVDVTPYVRSFSTRRGRNHELGRTQAGTAQIVLDNTDRRFDPTNGSSPYSPNVRPMQHVRIRALHQSTTYDVFRGYVQDFGQQWGGPAPAGKGDAFVPLQAVDAFLPLQLAQIRAYATTVLGDNPLLYWPLTDAANDEGGVNLGSEQGRPLFREVNVADGAFSNYVGTLGRATSPYAGATSLDCPAITTPAIGSLNAFGADIGATTMTLEMWVNLDAIHANDQYLRVVTTHGYTQAFDLDSGGGTGTLKIQVVDSDGTFQSVTTAGTVLAPTGAWHHIVAVRDQTVLKVYADGVLSDTFPIAIPSIARPFLAGFTRVSLGYQVDGAMAHVAVYDHALDAPTVTAHYSATLDTLTAVGAGTALGYVLDAAGWPAGLRSLDAGLSTVTLTPDGTALELLQAIAEDTEHGLLTVTPAGVVTFTGRDTLEKRVTASATFGDGDPSTGEVRYGELELSYDDQDLWTEVEASGAGGTTKVVVGDAAAQASYGRRTLSTSGVSALQNDLADQANGLLNRYKAPAVRPVSMVLRGDSRVPQQMQRVIGDRVTVKRRPPGTGTLSVDAFVEGIDHDVGPDGWPSSAYRLAPPEPVAFAVLGTATLGTALLGW